VTWLVATALLFVIGILSLLEFKTGRAMGLLD